jgi:hypothetical protein
MANLGPHHALISQILVASLLVGLPIYLLGFLRRPAFLRPLASLLLVVGTVTTFVAVESGPGFSAQEDAAEAEGSGHVAGPAPHQSMGERARNIFAGVIVLELIALGLAWEAGPKGASVLEVESGSLEAVGASTKRFAATTLRILVALGWTLGALHLYDTMRHGRELAAQRTAGVEQPVPGAIVAQAPPGISV